MTYYIRKTDGSILTTLTEKELDEQYSMYLVGYPDSVMGGSQGDIKYHDAEIINSNFIRLLENSADNTAPDNPIEGQLWYDKTLKSLKFWNGSSWTEIPASDIGYANQSLDNLDDDGEARFDSKANISLDNLDDEGKNIANWSSNLTNCITEIPQDIKLELNNGTLTLKAGSKVYIANGDFEPLITPSDKTLTYNQNGKAVIWYDSTINILRTFPQSICFSGDTTPTFTGNYAYWFDTANKKCKFTGDAGSTWTENQSLPLAIVTISDGAIASIDQIFNGFGYIGSTVFALPGVKGLAPNERNEDGGLKSIEITTSTVSTYNMTADKVNLPMYILSDGTIDFFTYGTYFEDVNKNIKTNNNSQILGFEIGKFSTDSNGKITSFTTKTPFHALDYNDFNEHRIVDSQQPTSSNNYTWYRLYSDGWVEQGGLATIPSRTGSGSSSVTVTLPIIMTDGNYTGQISYQNGGNGYAQSEITMLNKQTTSVNLECWTDMSGTTSNFLVGWEIKGVSTI